jgi:hypothetical protein
MTSCLFSGADSCAPMDGVGSSGRSTVSRRDIYFGGLTPSKVPSDLIVSFAPSVRSFRSDGPVQGDIYPRYRSLPVASNKHVNTIFQRAHIGTSITFLFNDLASDGEQLHTRFKKQQD